MAWSRVAIGFPLDSALPKDVVTINPHYQGDNPQALADALKVNLIANVQIGAATPFKIKVYDAQKAAPSYPLYETINGTGFRTTDTPRETALCLSYYASFNRPRYRGRVYIPGAFVGAPHMLRPSAGQIANCMLFADTLSKNLPSAHHWSVWSKRDATGRPVTDAWVDDEWDTVRSRGLRGTQRTIQHVYP
jgi:hypothetical protein